MTSNAHPQRTPWAVTDPLLTEYYDEEWGLPVTTERGVFERLTLEAFQSGLSWLTILKKRQGFRDAFVGFDPDAVATFDDAAIEQLLQNTAIIRNRRKVTATITNARATVALRDTVEDGLPGLVWSHMPERSPVFQRDEAPPSTSPESEVLARTLKQHGFVMVGPTTIFALMSAIGIVDLHAADSFRRGCSGLWNHDGTRSDLAGPFQR